MADEKRHRSGFFLFADDWRGDEALALCSEGARLLWLEMLLVMNKAEGHMLVNGRAPTPEKIAVITRTDPAQVVSRLAELRDNGVFSVTKGGVIYSRRMVRDEKKARIARENGKKGGNPSLCNNSTIPPLDKGSVKSRARGPNPSLPLAKEEEALSAPFGVSPLSPADPLTAPLAASPLHEDHTDDDTRDDTGAGPGCDGIRGSTGKARHKPAAGNANRGTRCPWERGADLPPGDQEFARAAGFDPVKVGDEFIDYWRGVAGKAGSKLDWSATFRNRVRQLLDRQPRNRGAAPQRRTAVFEAYEDAIAADAREARRTAGRTRQPDEGPIGDDGRTTTSPRSLSGAAAGVRWEGGREGDPRLAEQPRLVAYLGGTQARGAGVATLGQGHSVASEAPAVPLVPVHSVMWRWLAHKR